jgi:ribulose-5-phosphate 4-epimerase/fuculose-1-phosphate aldolase
MNASLKPVQISADAERQARIELAACYRLAERFGLNEGIDNHMTLLVPGYTDRFLLAPFGMHWSEVKASDFMVVDFGGKVLSGNGSVEDTALYIHQPVHRLSPQGRCVLCDRAEHAGESAAGNGGAECVGILR